MSIVWDPSQMSRTLHPAIDILDDELVFGLPLPVERDEDVREELCFITSGGKIFSSAPGDLKNMRIRLKYPPVFVNLRWSLDSIKKFLDHPDDDPDDGILNELVNAIKKYIEFYGNENEYVLLALWIIGTYLQPIWISYPYLGISGAKRCGKSKVLKFLELTAFNAIFSTSISTPSLYRLIQCMRCTLLMDEAEALQDPSRKTELKNILYSGYKKYGYVFRSAKTMKDVIYTERFEVFSPKAFVTYKGLEEILNDRSIGIVMVRSANPSIVNLEIDEADPIWQELRDKLYTFAMRSWGDIRKIYQELPEVAEIASRERELWRPILAMAKYFGDDVYNALIELAKKKIEEKMMEEQAEAWESILLSTLRRVVKQDGFYAVVDIKNAVKNFYDVELTNDWIGSTLSKKFGFTKAMRLSRPGRPVARWIEVKKILELCQRYGVQEEPEEEISEENNEEEEEQRKISRAWGEEI